MPARPSSPPSPLGRVAAAVLGLVLCAASPAWADEHADVQRLMKDKQYAQALKLIDEYLAKKPDDPKMRFRKGVVLSYQDKPAEALKVFQKLAEDHPDMPAPYNNIAVLLAARGDYDRARAALEAAIRTNPAYATAYQNLGDVYARLASQAYSKALSLDKTDTNLPPKLALLRELTAEPATALASAEPSPAPSPAAAPAPAPTVVAANKPPAAPPAPAPAAAPAAPPAATPAPAPATTVAAAASKPGARPPAAAPAPAAAASVAAATPTPAPAPPAKPAADAAVAEVTQAVQAWARAWAAKDLPAYFGAYSAEFAGTSGSRKAWEEDRRVRIAPRKRIKVALSDLKVAVDGSKATARFRQIYESDSLSTNSRKTLELVRDGKGRWLIRSETVG